MKPQAAFAFIERHARHAQPCILCRRVTHNRALFRADAQTIEDVGFGRAPEGKTRTILYALCDGHQLTHKTAEKVEAALAIEQRRARARAQAN